MWMELSDWKIPARGFRPSELKARVAAALKVPETALCELRIVGESVDARRGEPVIVYRLRCRIEGATPGGHRWKPAPEPVVPSLELPECPAGRRNPIVVGTGPAGIFGALALALAGANPVILDRGRPVARRVADWDEFLQTRTLDPSSNLLIGEGGAGTFSDGKLYSGTRDPNREFILNAMVEAGAPAEILYRSRPHVGSDRLRTMAVNLRKRIESLGGTFRFETEVTGPWIRDGRCVGVLTGSGERLEAPAVLISHGLGGRELTRRLLDAGVAADPKSFQLGCRIEHPQALIDVDQYHLDSRPEALGAAEYHLVSRSPNAPHTATFCMCPGGEIVMGSAWPGQLITNGMSYYARDGEFANSALIVTLENESIADAYALLRQQETAWFKAGGGRYDFPAQEAAGFLRGYEKLDKRGSSVATGLTAARLDRLLHPTLAMGIRAALRHFDRLCPGFIRYGRLIAGESCVSSPVRFRRDPETLSSSIPGLYLGGEGAGQAGGIVSSAADGLRLARAILS